MHNSYTDGKSLGRELCVCVGRGTGTAAWERHKRISTDRSWSRERHFGGALHTSHFPFSPHASPGRCYYEEAPSRAWTAGSEQGGHIAVETHTIQASDPMVSVKFLPQLLPSSYSPTWSLAHLTIKGHRSGKKDMLRREILWCSLWCLLPCWVYTPKLFKQ